MYFVRFVLFCTDAVNDFLAKNCPYIAGAISFYALFSFFPLVLAIITAAGLINGLHLTGRDIATTKVVMNGAGAASIACWLSRPTASSIRRR